MPSGRIHIIPDVWEYMQYNILGGIRRFARGRLLFFRGVAKRERRRSNRIEVPLRGKKTKLVLSRQRPAGRGKAIGLRIFKAVYEARAAGEVFLNKVMPPLVERSVRRALRKHSQRKR